MSPVMKIYLGITNNSLFDPGWRHYNKHGSRQSLAHGSRVGDVTYTLARFRPS